MSGKSKAARLESLLRSAECFFIGNQDNHEYHYKGCPEVGQIIKDDLAPLGKNPPSQGYHPCPFCKPLPLLTQKKDAPRSDMTVQKLLLLAAEKGMTAKLMDPNIYITTAAGEWYFNFRDRPIIGLFAIKV